jgi:hypothetical protein
MSIVCCLKPEFQLSALAAWECTSGPVNLVFQSGLLDANSLCPWQEKRTMHSGLAGQPPAPARANNDS